jgi:lipid II:glycine glycyltransferase (peptidoglycan interpeptide bridge formation enzyme)
MKRHILQSQMWQEFKNSFGTPAIMAGGILYTKHKIPFTNFNYAYCPRVNPSDINFEELKKSLIGNLCAVIHFDVPNVIKGSVEEKDALEIFNKYCVKSSRDEFAKANFLLDLTASEGELFNTMSNKQRYNTNYAIKKGVTVRKAVGSGDFETFFGLYKETGDRQGFYFRPRTYLKKAWEVFSSHNGCDILIAEHQNKPLSSWMLFIYDGILYYPYGGSTEEMKNLQANCLIGWEAIKYGKEKRCELFDMWGAAVDLNDQADPYYGFSQFKAKYGGQHVLYIDSYDLVLNESVYKIFNIANNLRWKALNILR